MIPGSFGLNRVESSGIVGEFASQQNSADNPVGNSRREGRADSRHSAEQSRAASAGIMRQPP